MVKLPDRLWEWVDREAAARFQFTSPEVRLSRYVSQVLELFIADERRKRERR